MAGQNAGTITYDVTADTSKLKADVAKAQSDLNATGAASADKATEATNKQAAATSALGDRLRGVKKTYGEQIEVVQGLIGKIAAVGAIAATFYKIGEVIGTQIVDKLQSASDKAAEFMATVNRADAAQAVKQTSDKIQELNARIAKTYEIQQIAMRAGAFGSLGKLFAEDREKLIEERNRLNNDLKGLSNQRIAKEKEAEDKAAQDRGKSALQAMEQFNSLTQSAMRDNMTEEAKIRLEAEEKKRAISQAFVKLTEEQQIAAQADAQRAVEAIQAEADNKLKAIADQQQKEAADREKEMRALAEQQAEEAEAGRQRIADEQERRREAFEDFQAQQRKAAELAAQAAEENARSVQQSWSNAYRAIREESNRAFATDQAASMVQFASQLRIEGMTAAANMNRIEVQGVG